MFKAFPCLVFVALLAIAGPASAQATRTWVSGVGDDANPCSRTAPCKTWAGAISKTAASGEIDALDPGGFGAVTITKAITLDGGAGLASVLVSGTNGITIAAGSSDVVTIRRLSLNGLNTSLSGINYVSGAAVHVEDCYIFGFQTAISFTTSSATVAPTLLVRNTVMHGNSTADLTVGSTSSSATVLATATIEKSTLADAPIGLNALAGAVVTAHDSIFTNDATAGVQTAAANSNTPANPAAQVNLERGVVANCGTGINSNGSATISNVMISNNTQGLTGTVASFGNNAVAAGNTTNGAPSSTLQQQ
jgi:hypothetical protein